MPDKELKILEEIDMKLEAIVFEFIENYRLKVSKEIRIGMELTIRQGFEQKTGQIKALSAVRGGAPIAQQLYEETEVSIARRELLSSQRKLHNLARPEHRPSKKDRRDINRFKQDNDQQFDQQWSYLDD